MDQGGLSRMVHWEFRKVKGGLRKIKEGSLKVSE